LRKENETAPIAIINGKIGEETEMVVLLVNLPRLDVTTGECEAEFALRHHLVLGKSVRHNVPFGVQKTKLTS
jgi:hypothetical protein